MEHLLDRGEPFGLSRRRFLVGSAAAVGGLVLGGSVTACGGSPPALRQQAITHLRQTINAAPIHVAERAGLFAARGLQLETLEVAGGSQTVNTVLQTTGVGLASALAAVNAYAKGVRTLRIVGGVYGKASIEVLARPDSRVTAESLGGLRIGAGTPDSLSAYVARSFVQHAGFVPDTDVSILNVGDQPTVWSALENGLVDLACITPIFSTQQVVAGKARVVARSRDFLQIPDAVLVARADQVESGVPDMANWVDAIKEACALIRTDLPRASAAYAEGAEVSEELARTALEESADAFGVEFQPEWMPALLDAARGSGLIEGEISVDGLVDTRFSGGSAS